MEDVILQEYSDGFRQEVAALILKIQQDEFGVAITLDDQPDLAIIPSFYQKGNANFWIALHEGMVVGTIALIDIGHSEVALRKMFVDSRHRGSEFKTGQALMNKAFQWMSEHRVRAVTLGTLDRFEAAQRFYRKNGFDEIPKEALPAYFPRMPLDNKFYRKEIISSRIAILDYKAGYQPWFEKFNRAWIEKYFWMEPLDFQVLQHPDIHVIGQGGAILMAQYDNAMAGTVALKFVGAGVYEFTKMAVDENFRGKKIGKALAYAAIQKARWLGASKIVLYSNRILETAIALYRNIGFVEVPVDGTYARSDIKMELIL